MQELNENFIFERGEDPDVLLVLFTGFANKLQLQPFEFMQVSGLYRYSRIMVRDPSQRLYLCGIGGELDTFDRLLMKLRDVAQSLQAKRIITIGSSGGAHTALLVAHLLKADYAHAFAPFPYLGLGANLIRRNWGAIFHFRRTIFKLNFLPTGTRQYYNLDTALKTWNGHTKYFVHFCKHHRRDFSMSMWLDGLPGFSLFPYPCDQHTVIRYLARRKLLDKLFSLERQDEIADMLNIELGQPDSDS